MSRLLGPLRPRVMKNVLFKSTVTVLRFAAKPPECDPWGRFTLGTFSFKNLSTEKKVIKTPKKLKFSPSGT